MRQFNTFFYGSYINFKVLAEAGISKREFQVGKVDGFALTIGPLANITPEQNSCVYGIVIQLTRDELTELYEVHSKTRLGGEYLPEAVLVAVSDGSFQPALVYVAPELKPAPTKPDYIERILSPARQYGFPEWYLHHIESFKD